MVQAERWRFVRSFLYEKIDVENIRFVSIVGAAQLRMLIEKLDTFKDFYAVQEIVKTDWNIVTELLLGTSVVSEVSCCSISLLKKTNVHRYAICLIKPMFS